jgi:hypothetical protein
MFISRNRRPTATPIPSPRKKLPDLSIAFFLCLTGARIRDKTGKQERRGSGHILGETSLRRCAGGERHAAAASGRYSNEYGMATILTMNRRELLGSLITLGALPGLKSVAANAGCGLQLRFGVAQFDTYNRSLRSRRWDCGALTMPKSSPSR